MEHARLHLPDIEMLLAHGEKHGDIFRCNHMALPEARTLEALLPFRHDLRHIMAEHLSHSIFGTYKLHLGLPQASSSGTMRMVSPARRAPLLITMQNMPSVGITHMPVSLLISQSL